MEKGTIEVVEPIKEWRTKMNIPFLHDQSKLNLLWLSANSNRNNYFKVIIVFGFLLLSKPGDPS
jgi:hypothetical protein